MSKKILKLIGMVLCLTFITIFGFSDVRMQEWTWEIYNLKFQVPADFKIILK